MFIANLLLYILGFILIWRGAGMILHSAGKFSNKVRLSPFAFSFVFLGILTSTPEFSVGLQSLADNQPYIFVGNLLGGIVVLLLLVIPMLAVFGKRISLKKELSKRTLACALTVILLPCIFVLDKRVTNLEGVIMILAYIGLLYIVERRNGIFDRENSRLMNARYYSFKDLLRIIIGIGIVFIASNLIVDKTIFFANDLNISPFYVGLLVIALGTDLPEISLAIRSIVTGKKEIAMGDYIGAAAVSTLLFGVFTLLNNGEVLTQSSFVLTFIFISLAAGLFYYFSIFKGYMNRRHGIILIGLYFCFVILELVGI